jgi:hypothetical protein
MGRGGGDGTPPSRFCEQVSASRPWPLCYTSLDSAVGALPPSGAEIGTERLIPSFKSDYPKRGVINPYPRPGGRGRLRAGELGQSAKVIRMATECPLALGAELVTPSVVLSLDGAGLRKIQVAPSGRGSLV